MKELFFYPESDDYGTRIDVYLSDAAGFTRSRIKTLIDGGKVFMNGEAVSKCGAEVRGGEIRLLVDLPREPNASPEDIPLDIIYEDDDIAVVNKPQGMVTHPASGSPSGTLVNAALFHIKNLSGINGVLRPGIVHRLDKDTSGLLIVAKNDRAHTSIAGQIAAQTAERRYIALVEGGLKPAEGVIDLAIARHKTDRKKMTVDPNGRKAVTLYKVLERFDGYTLAEFSLKTGRTHQIRVHCKALGHPIVGDAVYGKKDRFGLSGQLLHACKLSIDHPSSGGRMSFEAPLPDYFIAAVNSLRGR